MSEVKDFLIKNNDVDSSGFSSDIYNLVRNSHVVKKGSQFWNKDFGSNFHLLKRETASETNRLLVEAYSLECMQWLVNSGKARNPTAIATIDPNDETRFLFKSTIEQLNKEVVSFTYFTEVS